MPAPHGPWPISREYHTPTLEIRGRRFPWGGRTYLMAVINATPDSFSGDGTGGDPAEAARLACAFAAAGADLIDIGGESSRPGADPVAPEEELRRVIPAIEAARAASALPISVDTRRAAVASAALAAGADLVNDITGLRGDPGMAAVVARAGAPVVAMHNQRGRAHHDVAADIAAGFSESLRVAAEAGIDRGCVILDPGFGFGWTPEQNLELLRRLPELWHFEAPLLVGVSRKSTLGLVLGAPAAVPVEGTATALAIAVAAGADIVRVHDVATMARVARVADAIVRVNWHAAPP